MLANARKTPSAARKEKPPLMAPESELGICWPDARQNTVWVRTLTCFIEIKMVSCLCENQSLKKLYDYTLSLRFLPPLSRFRQTWDNPD